MAFLLLEIRSGSKSQLSFALLTFSRREQAENGPLGPR